MTEIKLFCPATIANLSCGFDVLGLCLDPIGDEMIIRKTKERGVKITRITGAKLPLENHKNVAGVAALALLNNLNPDCGFEIEIHKNIKAGSGIGSSAASAAGAVFGINELLGKPLTRKELIPFAMKGEALASGSEHADNVSPALLGGFTLVRSYQPLDVISINSPPELFVTVIHPQIELTTAQMRGVIPPTIPLTKAITQWGNLGGFIAGLYTQDYELIGRSLQDVIAEPLRGPYIPHFNEIQKAAIQNGALGAGISGSGPSVFALCQGIEKAQNVAQSMNQIYKKTEIPYEIHISQINSEGIKILA